MDRDRFAQKLSCVDELDLMKRIRVFKALDFASLSEANIFKEIMKVFEPTNGFSYLPNIATYKATTPFFRIRILEDAHIPGKSLATEQDFWNAPTKLITKYGRLNRPGESLLYTTPINPFVAIKEMNLSKDQLFYIICYTAQEDIKVNIIGGVYNYEKKGVTNKKAQLIHEMYNALFVDEFSRDVGIGTEYLYKISNVISKSFFDLPTSIQDAWAYPSVKDKRHYNVCFRPDKARQLLAFKKVLVARVDDVYDPKTDDIKIAAIGVINGINKDRSISLFSVQSEDETLFKLNTFQSKPL